VTPEEQQHIVDRDRCVRIAMFAADKVLLDNPDLATLPPAYTARVTVEAALGYLIGRGLITVKPDDQWPEWLAVDLPDHMRPDIAGLVQRWHAGHVRWLAGGAA
jgi:hypothetical protein